MHLVQKRDIEYFILMVIPMKKPHLRGYLYSNTACMCYI